MEKLMILCLLCTVWIASARVENVVTFSSDPPLVNGLSWTFYKTSCPALESIVKQRIDFYIKQDITQAAGLLRLHFHDCFVQGCDGSVLLKDGSTSFPSEQAAAPNLSLRAKAFEIINDIKSRVDKVCNVVVSCADVTALAAKESVRAAGGPEYRVPLGRRDSLKPSQDVTPANLPGPSSDVTTLIKVFASKNLNVTDLVALSGGHTIGIGHCSSFTNRLYPRQDSILNKSFAQRLYTVCPSNSSSNTTVLDIGTPNVFDNKYYADLMNRQGLFTSDQDLYTDSRTREIVKDFALDEDLFFQKFAVAMAKMSQLNVLTGSTGEIRSNCSVPNKASIAEVAAGDVVESHVSFM